MKTTRNILVSKNAPQMDQFKMKKSFLVNFLGLHFGSFFNIPERRVSCQLSEVSCQRYIIHEGFQRCLPLHSHIIIIYSIHTS